MLGGYLMHPHDSCWDRLMLAEEDLNTLDVDIRTALESGPNEVRIDVQPQPQFTEIRWIAHLPEPPPIRWETRVGEILRNIHSSIDHLVCHLARAYSGSDCEHTAFPVYRSVKAYNDGRKGFKKRVAGIDPEAVAILQFLQPCNSGHPPTDVIAILDKMANTEKHRIGHAIDLGTINPYGAISAGPGGNATFSMSIHEWRVCAPGVLEHGAEIAYMRATIHQATNMQVSVNSPLKIVFDNTSHVGAEVVPTVRGMLDFVRDGVFPLFDRFV